MMHMSQEGKHPNIKTNSMMTNFKEYIKIISSLPKGKDKLIITANKNNFNPEAL
jgi:hypothetical protein